MSYLCNIGTVRNKEQPVFCSLLFLHSTDIACFFPDPQINSFSRIKTDGDDLIILSKLKVHFVDEFRDPPHERTAGPGAFVINQIKDSWFCNNIL